MSDDVHRRWPTVLAMRRHPDAAALNPQLLVLFQQHAAAHGDPAAATYASDDDLLRRYPDHRALQSLFGFLSDAVFQAASAANEEIWAQLGAPRLRIVVVGAWFQRQNHGGRHGVHNHGNCSWSGVYVVDVDPEAERAAHPHWGEANGVTRFHSPHLPRLGGAHMDLGSAYLQHASFDVAPEPGRAVVFPSWLVHEALPYAGTRDRVIVSFNAQLHAQSGAPGLPYGF